LIYAIVIPTIEPESCNDYYLPMDEDSRLRGNDKRSMRMAQEVWKWNKKCGMTAPHKRHSRLDWESCRDCSILKITAFTEMTVLREYHSGRRVGIFKL